MLTEKELKKEARLMAIEHLLMHQFALTTLYLTAEQFEKMNSNWRATLDRETFEGTDAAVSDLLSAEIRDAVLALLQGVADNRKDMLSRLP